VHQTSTRLASARLYLCTDARRDRGDLAEFADAALAGGVDIIQLRDKGSPGEQRLGPLDARDELAALEVLADAARRHGALLAVNDRADIAHAAGAAVLHLGQDDLPLRVARDIVGPDTLIGRSTHDRQQVASAIAEDVAATVDFNLVMNSAGEFIEVQGSGEEATFSEKQLADLLALGKSGIRELLAAQETALAQV